MTAADMSWRPIRNAGGDAEPVTALLVLVGSTQLEKNQTRPEGRQTLRRGLRRR